MLQYVCWEIVAVDVLSSFGGLLFRDFMSYYGKCFVKYSGCLLGGCLLEDCCWRMFAGLGIVIFWGSATQECFGVCNRCPWKLSLLLGDICQGILRMSILYRLMSCSLLGIGGLLLRDFLSSYGGGFVAGSGCLLGHVC